MEALAAQEVPTGGVNFHGYLAKPALAGLMQRAAGFVLPSRVETFGCALIEAMSCGCPVLTTRVGGVPAVVPDGDGVFTQIDACPVEPDAGQTDQDQDQLGDACDPNDDSVPPCELDCNVNGDSFGEASLIDHRDIELIFAAVGTRAQGFAACGDRRDRDQDRLITILDAAACVEQCSFENCAEPGE